jgi:DNA (cytosine-5)-methyltransferase 1
MRYLSVCSGIEAATVGWHQLGWEPAGFAEIEPFPSAVLAHHYPTVKNFGDMSNYKEWNLGTVDLLVGGTPCQSFSVAGLRKGLADPRGNLALVYCGILDHFRPKWCVWENVPGVLSSNGGRDFGSFVGALAELGYGFAYRVLDAQYFGVAQRRRRVFVVGYLGDWRPAAEVLFEPESLRRDPAPSREAGQKVAGTFKARANSGGWGSDVELAAGEYMQPVTARMVAFGEYVDDGTASAMKARDYKDATDLIAQPIVYDTTNITSPQNGSNPQPGDPCFTLAKGQHPPLLAQPMAFDGYNQTLSTTSQTIRSDKTDGDHIGMVLQGVAQPIPLNTMNAMRSPDADASTGCGIGEEGEAMFTLTKGNSHAVAQPTVIHGTQDPCVSDVAFAQGLNSGGENVLIQSMAVRRLTPIECERLQGFPDNYTNIPWRKQPESPDGPRYKALGNSMAVPVMGWIGKRIQQLNH